MDDLIHPVMGSADETVFDGGFLASFRGNHRLEIGKTIPGVRMFVRTQTGSIYKIEIIDPAKREVEVRRILPKNGSKHFGSAQRCLLRGAVCNKDPRAPRAPGWIVQGLPMEFWGVKSAESEVVITSPVERFFLD
ncbi:hypothetical protein HYT45_03590 [Candidatus Uhrbacteria bacterium]|nr:hypothetical protein [Candidatus Uhrbacteria bacterium]